MLKGPMIVPSTHQLQNSSCTVEDFAGRRFQIVRRMTPGYTILDRHLLRREDFRHALWPAFLFARSSTFIPDATCGSAATNPNLSCATSAAFPPAKNFVSGNSFGKDFIVTSCVMFCILSCNGASRIALANYYFPRHYQLRKIIQRNRKLLLPKTPSSPRRLDDGRPVSVCRRAMARLRLIIAPPKRAAVAGAAARRRVGGTPGRASWQLSPCRDTCSWRRWPHPRQGR